MRTDGDFEPIAEALEVNRYGSVSSYPVARLALSWGVPLGLTLLALAVRVHRLGANSLWYDETVSLINAGMSIPQLIDAARADLHPPLYYLLLHFWLTIPVPGTRHPEAWARMFSVLCSAATVALTYVTCMRLLHNRTAAVVASVLLALSPAHVAQAQEARMYPLLGLVTIADVLLLSAALARDTLRAWLAFAVVSAALPWSQYYGLFVLAGLGVAILVIGWEQPRMTARGLLALAAGGAPFLLWVPSMLGQFQRSHGRLWQPPLSAEMLGETGRQLTFLTPPDHGWLEDPLPRWGAYIFALLAVIGIAFIVQKRRKGIVLLLILGIPIVLGAFIAVTLVPIYEPRYFLFLLPAGAVVVAAGLTRLSWRWLQLGLLVVLLCADAVCLQALFGDDYYARPDLRQVAREIVQDAQPGDVILHTALGTQVPVDYYTGPSYPAVEIEPPTRVAVDTIGEQYARVWLVRIEDTDAWGYMVDEDVKSFMQDYTLVEKWPLTGVGLYLYHSNAAPMPPAPTLK